MHYHMQHGICNCDFSDHKGDLTNNYKLSLTYVKLKNLVNEGKREMNLWALIVFYYIRKRYRPRINNEDELVKIRLYETKLFKC